MRKLVVVTTVVIALVLAGCGGGASDDNAGGDDGAQQNGAPAGSESAAGDHGDHGDHDEATAGAECTPEGTALTITASGTAFNKDCLAAPAHQAATLTFVNEDSAAHNLAVLESHTASDVLFRGDIVMGPRTVEYRLPALDPGTYAFHCEVHPDKMQGTFVVK